jgi:hypothetical protein
MRRIIVSCFVGSLLLLAGCNSDGMNKAPVSGKVLANGQPVTEGSLLFAPQAADGGADAGIPALGKVQQDGTFTLGTSGTSDGAVIGKHQVIYNPPRQDAPDWDGYGTPPAVKVSPFAGLVPKQAIIEVKAGKNEITIELVPAPPEQVMVGGP